MNLLTKSKKLFKGNFRITLQEALIYRTHTLFFLLFESIFYVGNFYTMYLGFKAAGGNIRGWTLQEGFLVSSIFNFTHQIFLTFFTAFIFDLGEKVWNGTLDFILLKPHKPLVSMWVSTVWILQNIPTMILSFLAMIYFMYTSEHPHISFISVLVCLAFIVLGVFVRVSLALICVSPVFFSERLHAVDTYWNVVAVGLYPQMVLPKALQYAFTFLMPIFLVSSVPAEAFFGMRSAPYLIISYVMGLVFCFVGFRIFHWALSHYKSVNAGI